MLTDTLTRDLYTEICAIPLIDPHSHINPLAPAARNLDEILGYHYYTELAHSAGMDRSPLASTVPPRERVRAILAHMDRFDNTAQYGWFLEIARTFLGFQGDRLTAADADSLWTAAEKCMKQPDWANQVLKKANIETVFLTNDFDDPLEGFDATRYVPCLRTDDLVFDLDMPEVRRRLAKATNIEMGDSTTLRLSLMALFEHFIRHGARACAISLPPDFTPETVSESELDRMLKGPAINDPGHRPARSTAVFWILAEQCRYFGLPFDLMIGVNRRVFTGGVHQGKDLFDQRTSLIQYAELFNAFGEVPFCISVLTSAQNQELASYSWIFPNVVTSGHWWYSNIPVYIERDTRARLQAVPKTKQLGYYSDMYKVEFGLPKFNMYRRILARILADDFVRPGIMNEKGAVDLARLLLRDNARRIFKV
jgi:glucuronate isomerase